MNVDFVPCFSVPICVLDVLKFCDPTNHYREYYKQCGMSRGHVWYNWLGGYHFEAAKPREILAFFRKKSFAMQRMKTCGGGFGRNRFVFAQVANTAI